MTSLARAYNLAGGGVQPGPRDRSQRKVNQKEHGIEWQEIAHDRESLPKSSPSLKAPVPTALPLTNPVITSIYADFLPSIPTNTSQEHRFPDPLRIPWRFVSVQKKVPLE